MPACVGISFTGGTHWVVLQVESHGVKPGPAIIYLVHVGSNSGIKVDEHFVGDRSLYESGRLNRISQYHRFGFRPRGDAGVINYVPSSICTTGSYEAVASGREGLNFYMQHHP